MAYEEALKNITFVAGADLSGSQYLAIKNNVVAGAGVAMDGINQNKPLSGQAGTLGISGVSKGVAGGTVAAGADLAVDAAGKFVTAAGAGTMIVGTALAAAVADDIFPILINVKGTVPV